MTPPTLARRLGTTDAVVVGLSAMIGAGIFSVFAPAAEAAGGRGLLIGLVVAAVVATCNAVSTAQLATAYPSSGGSYVYGREVLGEWWGFLAGWAFVVGKTASCAAMAMTFAAYAVPGSAWVMRGAAVAAVLLLTAANLRGVTRTASVARVLLVVTLVAVIATTVAIALGDPASPGERDLGAVDGGALGVLQAAGLLFFAFAGYARIATLAEEVREPATLTRAVLVALGVAVVLYGAVAVVVVRALGDDLAQTITPLADAAEAAGVGWAGPVIRVGAATASLGALLALLAGVGRTSLAMARERDLPGWLASISPQHRVPDHAQLTIAALVVALVLVADLRQAIGFSSCGVLVYYAVANLSALRQPAAQRRSPRAVAVLGLVGCVVLVATLPTASLVGGVVVLAVGVVGRAVRLRRDAR
ncbi:MULTISPECIES: APC family permease [unclassified Nocardioides]|uniref:APC family permease n=1 Tax=unclassified Nocardioides TaxID=2615069 RepID=UPI0030143647